jgi:hypothetical protein
MFRLNEDQEGKRATDGYQAVWEFINQRPMLYPKPRYHDPIMMYPENFEWTDESPGVSFKSAGSFSELNTGADFVRLEPGARWTLEGRAIAFVLRGAGVIQGDSYEKHTTTLCEEDEAAEFRSSSETELLLLRLPRFMESAQLGKAAE